MRFILSSRPVVTAIAACFGSRPGGERVRRDVVDDVHARLRKSRGDAQSFDDVVQARVLHRIRRPGATHRERNRVGLPVRDERRTERDHERDDDADPSELEQRVEHDRDDDREQHERRDQKRGPSFVGGDLVVQGEGIPVSKKGLLRGLARGRRWRVERDLHGLTRLLVDLEVLRGVKCMAPATTTAGNVWILVL